MDEKDILRRIIQEDGNCCWSKPSICKQCPLSKLKTKADGTPMNCIEAIGVEDLSEEDADKKYKEVATRILLDETIEDLLRDKDVAIH